MISGLLSSLRFLAEDIFRLYVAEDVDNHWRFVALHLVCTFLISIAYIPAMIYLQYDIGTGMCVAFVFCHIGLLLGVKQKISLTALTNYYCLMALSGFTLVAATSGGISSPQIAWFLAIKVGAFWFGGRRMGYFWSGMVFMVIFLLTAMNLNGYWVGYHFPEENKFLFSSNIHIGVLFYYVVVIQVYENEKQRSFEELKDSAEKQTKFFRIVAHDLKNPLAVILGNLEMLLRRKAEYSSAIQKRLGKIGTHSQSMLSTIDHLLSLDKLSESIKKATSKVVNASKIVDEAVYKNISHAEIKNIQINAEIPEEALVFGDERIIEQIIDNLLSNAVKFSPENTSIHLDMNFDTPKKVVVKIQDQGLGMSEDDIRRFFKGGGVSNKPIGNETSTGVGREAILENIAALGGKLELESDGPGKGSCFTVTLARSDS